MTKSLSDIQKELLGTFFEESLEGLEQLEAGLLSLESSPEQSADTINDVFRAAHSIKGGAGSFGLGEVGGLAHAMESLLEEFRSGHSAPTQESLAALLQSVDLLRTALDARRADGVVATAEIDAQCARLSALRTSSTKAQPPRPEASPTETSNSKWRVTFRPLPRMLESGNEPVRLLRELGKLGQAKVEADSHALPSLTELDPNLCYLSWRIELEGPGITKAAIDEVFSWVDTDAEIVIEALTETTELAVAPAAVLPAASAEREAVELATGKPGTKPETKVETTAIGSIRVGVDKIDLLMNMVGELVITQSMLGVIDHDTQIDARRIEQLREGLGLLARNTRSLQESVMRLRSVPISVVFSRFPRLVH
ncbi:MAG TPA: Hpt domain-containing protein, partial [Polyangiaceae bacterium]|nr:Hpt domain-containing protein [Polyangiaceae bacterium]